MYVDTKTSFRGRDDTDYRIDFDHNGKIEIVNFGDGTNNDVESSGITNKYYYKDSMHHVEVVIPYEFLGIEVDEIIGISLGVLHNNLDWDGWAYAGEGFKDYVAPEYTNEYCRIAADNELYRASNNIEPQKNSGTHAGE